MPFIRALLPSLTVPTGQLPVWYLYPCVIVVANLCATSSARPFVTFMLDFP